MTRNLKALGIALVAIFAVSAMAASAAEAQGKLTSDGPVTLLGGQTGAAGSNGYTAFGGKSECPIGVGTGHKYNVTPHAFIPSEASQITFTPHAGKCIGLNKSATVVMNGCDGVFEFEGTDSVDTYRIKSFVICPPGNHVQLKSYEDEAHSKIFCTTTITENPKGYSGLKAIDTTNGTIDITGSISSITVHKEGLGVLCAKATTENAQVHVDATLSGKSESGGATPISLSD